MISFTKKTVLVMEDSAGHELMEADVIYDYQIQNGCSLNITPSVKGTPEQVMRSIKHDIAEINGVDVNSITDEYVIKNANDYDCEREMFFIKHNVDTTDIDEIYADISW